MSHWNDYETRDVFGNEDNEVNHMLRFQDGEEVLESVPFSDSHKKPRYEETDDVRSTIYYESSATEAPLPMKDASVLPSALKEGTSNILDPSLSLLSEKTAAVLGITKCSTGSTVLDSQGDKIIPTKSVQMDEKDIVNNTLCLNYGERGDAQNKKLFDLSSANNLVDILTKEQMSGEDDLLFFDYPSIGHFEDFDKMFRNHGSTFAQGSTVSEDEMSWFSSSSHGFHGVEDTLQSVVLSSVSASSAFNNASSAHGLSTNIFPGTKPLAIGIEFLSSTDCGSHPLYSDAGRKGKSLMSELAYDHTGMVEKSLMLDQVGYGNDCRSPNMIYTTLKELTPTKGKTIIPIFESTVQSSPSCCSLIQNAQDQELLTSFLPTQPHSLQAITKKTPFSESFPSNCSLSYNPQAQMSNIFKSSDLHDYLNSNNPLSHANHSMRILPGPFPIPSMPMEKNKKTYSGLQFPASWLMDKPLEQHMDKCLEQHAEESDSSPQRKYKFADVVEGVKEPAVNIGSSTIHDKSCMTSTFIDDVSIKTANFQQLQMIMDRLGVRTKLCIRDSLYRLAKSAEQSHCYGSENNVSRAGSPVRGFQGPKDSKRTPEYLGLSISTNEIERAVAYLLFHKSLGSATGTADDSIWLRTPMHIQDPFGKCKEPNQPSS